MRKNDWQLRFAEFVQARARMPFAWGSNDCCLFTVDAVQAMTGIDHAATLRGYTTPLAAERILRERGGVRQLAINSWGDPVPPTMAGIGDVVLMVNEGRELLAICNGTCAIGAGPDGIAVMGMDAAVAAWKI